MEACTKCSSFAVGHWRFADGDKRPPIPACEAHRGKILSSWFDRPPAPQWVSTVKYYFPEPDTVELPAPRPKRVNGTKGV